MQYQRVSATERQYLPPAVAVSVVAFAIRPPEGAEQSEAGAEPSIWLPLVRRTRAPFLGDWALPGGPTEWNETLADTAQRTLGAAAGRDPGYLEQLYSFGGVERSADAQRLVTIAYWALYGEDQLGAVDETSVAEHAAAHNASAGSRAGSPADGVAPVVHPPAGVEASPAGDTSKRRRWDDPLPPLVPAQRIGEDTAGALQQTAGENVRWFSIDALPELAFDHAQIIEHAVARLRARTEYQAVAHRLLGSRFTLGQLRTITEAVTGQRIDPANFRRQALARGGLIDTGDLSTGGAHRPSRLYRFDDFEDTTRNTRTTP